jgi:hypothetical protein
MEQSKDRECIFGLMDPDTKANGMQMKCREKGSSNGLMADILKVNLNRVLCTDSEFILGKTVVDTKASIVTIRNMERVLILTLMAASTKENGWMVSSMVLVVS